MSYVHMKGVGNYGRNITSIRIHHDSSDSHGNTKTAGSDSHGNTKTAGSHSHGNTKTAGGGYNRFSDEVRPCVKDNLSRAGEGE